MRGVRQQSRRCAGFSGSRFGRSSSGAWRVPSKSEERGRGRRDPRWEGAWDGRVARGGGGESDLGLPGAPRRHGARDAGAEGSAEGSGLCSSRTLASRLRVPPCPFGNGLPAPYAHEVSHLL